MVPLQFTELGGPGIIRTGAPGSFAYLHSKGGTVKAARVLKRIDALAIPPAWTDVWICPHDNGHIQAIGYDVKGRRQYRYHSAFSEHRKDVNFTRLPAFARALPRIRATVAQDMARPGIGHAKVVATAVHLLEHTLIRVGNSRYALENRTFGLTTLKRRHATIEGQTLRLRFLGKSGKTWNVEFKDRRVARVLARCQEMPGQHLFQYIDDNGEVRAINSRDINSYLRAAAGTKISAKDFRTWAGTMLFALALSDHAVGTSRTAIRRQIAQAVRFVADCLGNTPAVCRSAYIHPRIPAAFESGTLGRAFSSELARRPEGEFQAAEEIVLKLLRQRPSARTPARGSPHQPARKSSRRSTEPMPGSPVAALSARS